MTHMDVSDSLLSQGYTLLVNCPEHIFGIRVTSGPSNKSTKPIASIAQYGFDSNGREVISSSLCDLNSSNLEIIKKALVEKFS